MDLTKEEVTKWIDENIVPILTRYGAKLTATFPEAHLTAKPLERFKVLEFECKGETISLDGSDLSPKNIEFLLKHWDRIDKVFHQLDKISDPFHSTIYGFLTTEFDKRTLDNSSLAYSHICNRIVKSGRRVWS